jgi:two-component system cell cycle response regulator
VPSPSHSPAADANGAEPYGFVRWIRSQDRLAFVPVFLFDGRGENGRTGEGVAAGADDVFDRFQDSPDSRVWASEAAERIVARIARCRSLAHLALLDPLTELHNRRFMNDRLPAEVARARRANTVLSLLLIDLDE